MKYKIGTRVKIRPLCGSDERDILRARIVGRAYRKYLVYVKEEDRPSKEWGHGGRSAWYYDGGPTGDDHGHWFVYPENIITPTEEDSMPDDIVYWAVKLR
ncbi:MAG: hypothetical protein DRI48_06040, partial [Chloroflexi bacterium]